MCGNAVYPKCQLTPIYKFTGRDASVRWVFDEIYSRPAECLNCFKMVTDMEYINNWGLCAECFNEEYDRHNSPFEL